MCVCVCVSISPTLISAGLLSLPYDIETVCEHMIHVFSDVAFKLTIILLNIFRRHHKLPNAFCVCVEIFMKPRLTKKKMCEQKKRLFSWAFCSLAPYSNVCCLRYVCRFSRERASAPSSHFTQIAQHLVAPYASHAYVAWYHVDYNDLIFDFIRWRRSIFSCRVETEIHDTDYS